MADKKQKTKRAAPQPKGFSWGATQSGSFVKSTGKAVSIKSPRDSASGVASVRDLDVPAEQAETVQGGVSGKHLEDVSMEIVVSPPRKP